MKSQEVNVDYWAMLKGMLTYGALTAAGWVMMRLFSMVFTFPRRMRAQQDRIQNTLEDLQVGSFLLWAGFMDLYELDFLTAVCLTGQNLNIKIWFYKFQRRFPDLNITEEDLKDAEKELDELLKEEDEKKEKSTENNSLEKSTEDESKKTI